jgi:methyl-accepting chemotaxis protein
MASKLMILVGVNLLTAALVIVAGTLGLQGVRDRARDISQNNLMSLEVLSSIRSGAQQVETDIANLALSTGPVALTFFSERMDAEDSRIDSELARYSERVSNTAQARSVDKFRIWWGAYQRYRENRLIPLADGDPTVFQQAYLGQGQIVAGKAMAALDELSLYEQESGQAATAQAESTYRSSLTQMGAALAAGLLLALLLAVYLTRLIVRPVREVATVLEEVAAGDLTAQARIDQRDEVGHMATALATATGSMRQTVGLLADNSIALTTAAEELTAVSEQIRSSAMDTSDRAGMVAHVAGEVSGSVASAATGTDGLAASVQDIAQSTAQGSDVAQTAVRIAEAANSTIGRLGDSSSEIGEVVKVIDSIAQQTNLLALNATIEAARSGEAGKGFAVVASEVKELAQETGRATEDITRRVEAIQSDSGEAVSAIARITDVISKIHDYQSTVAAAVEEQAMTTRDMNRDVVAAAEGSGQIATTITGVANAAQSTNHGVSQVSESVAELARMASDMRTLVTRFTY